MIMQGILQGSTGGGAGVTPPSLDVGLVLSAVSPTIDFQIINQDPVNPSVVELSFDGEILMSQTWDDGDQHTPSIALDPGSSRDVTFTRSIGTPNYGVTVSETVTATLADGSTVSSSVSVLGPEFSTALSGISPVTIEYRMDQVDVFGKLVNTGSRAGYPAVMSNCVATQELPITDGFYGYVEVDGTADKVVSSGPDAVQKEYILRTQDRSYVMVWDNEGVMTANKHLTICTAIATDNGWGWIQTTAANVYQSRHLFASGIIELDSANGTNDNLLGSAEDFDQRWNIGTSQPIRCILAVVYDHGTGIVTFRWKQDGDGPGHTYYSEVQANQDVDTNYANVSWMGWTSNAANMVKWRYIGVVDKAITSEDFEILNGLVIP